MMDFSSKTCAASIGKPCIVWGRTVSTGLGSTSPWILVVVCLVHWSKLCSSCNDAFHSVTWNTAQVNKKYHSEVDLTEHTGTGQSFYILRQSWSQVYLPVLRWSLPTSMLQGYNHPWFSLLLVLPKFEASSKVTMDVISWNLNILFNTWLLKLTSK